MPNWCFSIVVAEGPKEQIDKLYNTMNKLENMPEPYSDNGFGKTWYGCLVDYLGGSWENTRCRGAWRELEMAEDGLTLRWTDETAWGPVEETFKFIEKALPGIKIYFQSEEPGMELYSSNDLERKYFSDRYILASDWETEYYEDGEFDILLQNASELFGQEVSSKEQLIKLCDESDVICFHEFSLEE